MNNPHGRTHSHLTARPDRFYTTVHKAVNTTEQRQRQRQRQGRYQQQGCSKPHKVQGPVGRMVCQYPGRGKAVPVGYRGPVVPVPS